MTTKKDTEDKKIKEEEQTKKEEELTEKDLERVAGGETHEIKV